MAYLHAKNIVHFDLKSANLLLGYRDRRAICKVADFGLSKQKRDTYVSNVTSQRGTLPWIAPEIIKTPHAVTERVRHSASCHAVWHLSVRVSGDQAGAFCTVVARLGALYAVIIEEVCTERAQGLRQS